MNVQHKELAEGRWRELSLVEQLANVGSEVARCISWKKRNVGYAERARERALELLWLTKGDPKNKGRIRELARLYEVLVNDLYEFNEYRPDFEKLNAYFLAFGVAARMRKLATPVQAPDNPQSTSHKPHP